MQIEQFTDIKLLLESATKCAESSKHTWWVYAAYTDKLLLDKVVMGYAWEEILKTQSRLLELRIFSVEAEYRAIRGNIGQPLHMRKIFESATDIENETYFDERQYLDINQKKVQRDERGYKVWTTTGGGPYNLPLMHYEDAALKVRNYISYYETSGQAYVSDFRLVKLVEGRA